MEKEKDGEGEGGRREGGERERRDALRDVLPLPRAISLKAAREIEDLQLG